MKSEMKIAFIGGGNMATALIGGLAGKLTAGPHIHVIDLNPDALQTLNKTFGVRTSEKIDAQLADVDVIVMAVKPQQMHEVAVALAPFLKQQLVLSIAAGIRLANLSQWLKGYDAIVRTMPNTPSLIGQGVTGMVAMSGVSEAQRQAADAVMRAVGSTVWLEDESQIDAVTAVSGSGPAYVFFFIEAMQQAAQELGLSAEQGRQLAIATFVGASQLAAQSAEPVDILRERVTSKGGTTFAAITSMQASGVGPAIQKAMQAAAARSKALGEEFGKMESSTRGN
jgi:pyrroline-5-carboxylate reductase